MKLELELKQYPENTPTTHIIPLLTAVQSTVTGGFYWEFNEYLQDRKCFPRFTKNEYARVVAYIELPDVEELFKKSNETKNQMESVPSGQTDEKR